MRTTNLKAFQQRLDQDLLSLKEEELESVQRQVSSLWGKTWFKLTEPQDVNRRFGFYWGLYGVPIALGVFIYYAAVALNMASTLSSSLDQSPYNPMGSALTFLACYLAISIPIHFFTAKATLLDSLNWSLQILSSETDECQTVLDLCATVPAAQRLREDLLAAQRPLRRVHLWAMEELDPKNLASQLAEQREEAHQAAACKVVHGVLA